ncbi:two-component response regulator [Gracilibacillus halophilus YIM-C55.5]|uniref:Two-component response regulator n=1 Tax=Gracilibacillus halophilus YIM-C55.5 TaxID=1308866 RepID=N4WS33_9BACI|nr:response regulator transcription factor [Gracilibacillus halophilus]ENH95986.1 two-component response regulator [Gracilibacillus halophilus YIM-C55.5]
MAEVCRVLIVDDEMLIRQGIINYIDWEAEGFQIVGEASNGQEAMDMIEQTHPHIVITDIVMPVMDGIDVVKAVKRAYPSIEIVVLSSFENYDYVRSTFQNGVADYILKPKLNEDELCQILYQIAANIPDLDHTARQRSPEQLLETVLRGNESALDEAFIQHFLPYSQFVLVAILGKHAQPQLGDHVKVLSLLAEDNCTTFLLNFQPQRFATIKETIKTISSEDTSLTWIVARPFDSITEIKSVYEDGLLKMKQYLFYLPEQSFLIYDELPKEQKRPVHFDLNHFIDMFKNRQFHVAFTYLSDYIHYLASQYTKDPFEFTSFLGNIIFNMIVLLDNLTCDTAEIERKKYRYFANINEASNVNEALEEFYEVVNKIQTMIFSNDSSNKLDRMLAYIEDHYTETLRLSELADHFHFNPSYLSAYFSSHHKEGFSEYVNRVRIKKAMNLLESSTVSISDISGMVGYSEHSYFCKVFKRITGMSPSHYRKEYRYENETTTTIDASD